MSKTPRYFTAAEAAEKLGITAATLYAYVSRGLIRSEAMDDKRRTRRYLVEDVQKLIDRKEQQADPAKAAQSALHWGVPMMDSGITLINEGRFYYRGYDAAHLAKQHTLEEIAALIWTGAIENHAEIFVGESLKFSPTLFKTLSQIFVSNPALAYVQRYQIALAMAAADDFAAYDLSPQAVSKTGARILRLLTLTAVLPINNIVTDTIYRVSTAQILTKGWGLDEHAAYLLNAALILCADHELNVSAFTARVIASAETTPYAIVIGALSAMQGFKHGGNSERVAAMMRPMMSDADIRPALVDKLRLGERIPGFGHKLYPQGDPRAAVLLTLLENDAPDSSALHLAQAVIAEVRALIDIPPNIDFALVTLENVLNLPRGSALAIFALGRTIGWIGHAIEQYSDPNLIRPRARYIGIPPRENG